MVVNDSNVYFVIGLSAVASAIALAYGAYMEGEGVSVLRNCCKEIKEIRENLEQGMANWRRK